MKKLIFDVLRFTLYFNVMVLAIKYLTDSQFSLYKELLFTIPGGILIGLCLYYMENKKRKRESRINF